MANYLRNTVGATVEQFPLADLRTAAPAPETVSLCSTPESVSTRGVQVPAERMIYRWLCMANATTEADVELQRASLPLPDGYTFPGPRGWDTRLVGTRDVLLDIHEDVRLDRRTRERIIFGLSPKWTLFKQIAFPFLSWKFDLGSLSKW